MPVLGDGMPGGPIQRFLGPIISADINPDMNFIGVKNAIND
jgi:hypothetical protein